MAASQLKNIIVFGATGQTGVEILKKGIKENLQVTAFTRNPDKIPKDIREKLHKVEQGDIFDKQKVEKAIEGNEAVLSALGDGIWGKGTVYTGCLNIMEGMKNHGVKKLVIVGAAMLFPHERTGIRYHVLKWLQSAKDHIKQVDVLDNEKDLNWTLMMPMDIEISSTVNPDYLVQKDVVPGGKYVTSAELADFMVNLVIDDEKSQQYRQSKVGISSHPK